MDDKDHAGRTPRRHWNARLNPQAIACDNVLALPAGLHKLMRGDQLNAVIYIPSEAGRGHKISLLCLLHGAFGKDGGALSAALAFAAQHPIAVIAPQSMDTSWDLLRGGYGPDAHCIDYLLGWLMQRYTIDLERVALGGFSDGASYALSLGLKNGDLFTDIVAFSPGFVHLDEAIGRPRIFISHGSSDAVLPLSCGQEAALRLSREGYVVHYEQFAGGHLVPAKIVDIALTRFLASHP